MQRRALLTGLIALPGMLWLALSETPTSRRLRRINEKIRSGQLGSLSGVPASRLALQIPWLARHAGVASAVGVNVPIELHRLNVIVTSPEYRELTGCGLGNAIYDPTLQTIFLDKSLVWRLETLVEGQTGTISMFKLDEYTFVTSFVNFIVAHELGHWRRSSKPSACFRYGLLDDETVLSETRASDWTEEQVADRISVQTIVNAYTAKDTPAQIYALNSAILMGLETDRLDTAQLAAVDIVASMLEMTKVMLFSGGPYSPFFADSQHPNFLQRCTDAIKEVLGGIGDAGFLERLPLVREELRRVEAISENDYLELIFPEPMAGTDVRGDSLWVGTVPVQATPTSASEEFTFPIETLFRIRKDFLRKHALRSRVSVKASEAIATGDSAPKPGADPYSTPGLWIGGLFSARSRPRAGRLARRQERIVARQDVIARRITALRAKLTTLQAEMSAWKGIVRQEEFKPHTSQIELVCGGLGAMHALIAQDLKAALEKNSPTLEQVEMFERKILAALQIWESYRTKFALRIEKSRREALVLMDELAWQAYRPARDRAIASKAVSATKVREPPLVFPNACWSPFARSRERAYELDETTGNLSEMGDLSPFLEAIPVPVIGIPWYQLEHFPDAVFIGHEVGHLVEEDLQLQDALRDALQAALCGVSEERRTGGRATGAAKSLPTFTACWSRARPMPKLSWMRWPPIVQ